VSVDSAVVINELYVDVLLELKYVIYFATPEISVANESAAAL